MRLGSAKADAVVAVAVNALPTTARGFAAAIWTMGLVLLLLVPLGAVGQVVLTAQLDDRVPTQALVVLDPARSWGDPQLLRDARLDHAADLYAQGIAPVILVTGPRHDAPSAVARLEARGIPSRDIVSITTGEDTVGSLQVIAGLMRGVGWSSVTLVTDPAHAARAGATASGFGIDAHLSPADSGPGTALTSDSVGREVLALLRYHLLTRWQQPTILR